MDVFLELLGIVAEALISWPFERSRNQDGQ